MHIFGCPNSIKVLTVPGLVTQKSLFLKILDRHLCEIKVPNISLQKHNSGRIALPDLSMYCSQIKMELSTPNILLLRSLPGFTQSGPGHY